MPITLDGTLGLTLPGTGTGVQVGSLTLGTAQASTSGTSINFTGIPSWVKRITVMMNGISTNGTSGYIAQLIVNGTPVTSGYIGATDLMISGVAPAAHTIGFGISDTSFSSSAFLTHCCLTYIKFSDTVWNGSLAGGSTSSAGVVIGGGYVPISGTVTGIRITTLNGTDTFDAGSVNILYE